MTPTPLSLEQWIEKVGGPLAELIEIKKFASGPFALIRWGGNRKFFRIPGEVVMTFKQGLMVGNGAVSKLKNERGPYVRPLPYYPVFKW